MENFKAPKRKVKGAVEFPNYKWLLKESELRRIASLRAGMSQVSPCRASARRGLPD